MKLEVNYERLVKDLEPSIKKVLLDKFLDEKEDMIHKTVETLRTFNIQCKHNCTNGLELSVKLNKLRSELSKAEEKIRDLEEDMQDDDDTTSVHSQCLSASYKHDFEAKIGELRDNFGIAKMDYEDSIKNSSH